MNESIPGRDNKKETDEFRGSVQIARVICPTVSCETHSKHVTLQHGGKSTDLCEMKSKTRGGGGVNTIPQTFPFHCMHTNTQTHT